jgi:hypothetical protein
MSDGEVHQYRWYGQDTWIIGKIHKGHFIPLPPELWFDRHPNLNYGLLQKGHFAEADAEAKNA